MFPGLVTRVSHGGFNVDVLCQSVFCSEAEGYVHMWLSIRDRFSFEPPGSRVVLLSFSANLNGASRHASFTASEAHDTERKITFTLEMILAFQSMVCADTSSLAISGLAVAMLLAFSCLLRCSEYVPKRRNKHWLRARDVEFVLEDGRVVGSHSFSSNLFTRVREVIVRIRSSKTDQEGKGFTFVFSLSVPSTTTLCLTLMRWAVRANLQADDPFFSARDMTGVCKWTISASKLTKALRLTAITFFQFETTTAKRFTPHSLRYGGASTLAAANIPDYQIQMAGRWRSDAFMIYIKESFEIFVQTQKH